MLKIKFFLAKKILFLLFFILINIIFCNYTNASKLTDLRVFKSDPEIKLLNEFKVFNANNVSGGNVLVADLGTDGVAEIITVGGINSLPRVTVRRADGSIIREFDVYNKLFGRGVNLAAGDIDNDGINELIVGTGYRAAPHIRIFNGYGEEKLIPGGFFAFDKNYRTGVEVSVGDIDGDNENEIAATTAYHLENKIKFFDKHGKEKISFVPNFNIDINSIQIALGNVFGDNRDELIISNKGLGLPKIYIFSYLNNEFHLVKSFLAYNENFSGGVNISLANINNNDYDEIITGINGYGGAHVRIFNGHGRFLKDFFAYDDYRDLGIRVSAGDINNDNKIEYVVVPHHILETRDNREEKWIEVNIDKQQLYAWENGRLAHTFLISSGLYRYPTPLGQFKINNKKLWHDYIWEYGEEHPENYELLNVKYNMNFTPHYYIHYAYWHNNWGKRMSHGCVNVPYKEVEWLYNWSDIGMKVNIHN